MSHGLLWLPLLLAFVLLASLGWLERRRQTLFRAWAEGSELAKLDGCGGARLKDGQLIWSSFEAGRFQDQGCFEVCRLELVELMALASGEALTVSTRERPKLVFDAEGRKTHLLNGVCSAPACPDGPPTGCVDCKYANWDYTLVQPPQV